MERSHGVYQDRFVKELRLARISTLEMANRFLESTYLPAINARFAKVVSRDYVLQFERCLKQIPARLRDRPRPSDRAVVRKWLDGALHFSWQDKPLLVEKLPAVAPKGAPASRSA